MPNLYQQPINLTPGATSGREYITVPFRARYISIQNTTVASVQFVTGNRQTPLTDGYVVPTNKAYSGQMDATYDVTFYWTSSTAMTDTNNQVMVSFSDEPITMSVSESGSVTNVSGDINATIQNAEINSQVINASVPVNSLISYQQSYTISNLVANATMYVTMKIPKGYYDTYQVSSSCANTLNLNAPTVNSVLLGGVTLNLTHGTNVTSPTVYGKDAVGGRAEFDPLIFDTIKFSIYNNTSAAISDTITITVYLGVNQSRVYNTVDIDMNNPQAYLKSSPLIYVGNLKDSASTNFNANMGIQYSLQTSGPAPMLANNLIIYFKSQSNTSGLWTFQSVVMQFASITQLSVNYSLMPGLGNGEVTVTSLTTTQNNSMYRIVLSTSTPVIFDEIILNLTPTASVSDLLQIQAWAYLK